MNLTQNDGSVPYNFLMNTINNNKVIIDIYLGGVLSMSMHASVLYFFLRMHRRAIYL